MELEEIQSVLKHWYEFNCPREKSCTFASIGQHLLHHAIKIKKTLLTVQVGAMDGITGDPMHEMFVEEGTKDSNKGDSMSFVGGRESFTDLRNWLPIMIEPVPVNYETLLENYAGIAKTKGLG
jgi:hypothetical protein